MSVVVVEFATFLASFVISVVVNWELTLVTCTILPVIFISIYTAQKVNCIDIYTAVCHINKIIILYII